MHRSHTSSPGRDVDLTRAFLNPGKALAPTAFPSTPPSAAHLTHMNLIPELRLESQLTCPLISALFN